MGTRWVTFTKKLRAVQISIGSQTSRTKDIFFFIFFFSLNKQSFFGVLKEHSTFFWKYIITGYIITSYLAGDCHGRWEKTV